MSTYEYLRVFTRILKKKTFGNIKYVELPYWSGII